LGISIEKGWDNFAVLKNFAKKILKLKKMEKLKIFEKKSKKKVQNPKNVPKIS